MTVEHSERRPLEYRICWSASSNASFHGTTEWETWPDEAGAEEIEDALSVGGSLCDGLLEAIEASGFGWWIETQEASDA